MIHKLQGISIQLMPKSTTCILDVCKAKIETHVSEVVAAIHPNRTFYVRIYPCCKTDNNNGKQTAESNIAKKIQEHYR